MADGSLEDLLPVKAAKRKRISQLEVIDFAELEAAGCVFCSLMQRSMPVF